MFLGKSGCAQQATPSGEVLLQETWGRTSVSHLAGVPPLQEGQGSRKPIKKHATTTRDTSVKPFPIPSRHPTRIPCKRQPTRKLAGTGCLALISLPLFDQRKDSKQGLGPKIRSGMLLKFRLSYPILFFFFFWFLLPLNFSDTHWPRLSCNESLVALAGLERRWCWFDLPVCPQLNHPEMGALLHPKMPLLQLFPRKALQEGCSKTNYHLSAFDEKKKRKLVGCFVQTTCQDLSQKLREMRGEEIHKFTFLGISIICFVALQWNTWMEGLFCWRGRMTNANSLLQGLCWVEGL